MDVITTKTLRNSIFSIKFEIKMTDADNTLINKFGDPDVNYGGTIPYVDTDPLTYVLPDNWRKLRAGTGWVQCFDSNLDPVSQIKAEAYEAEIRDRIETVVAAIRANQDTFTQVNTRTV